MSSTALQVQQVHSPAPSAPRLVRSAPVEEFGQMLELARELVPTGFLPEHIKTAGQAVAIILQGRELGMQPMRALRSLTMVKGKVVENADSQLARFKDEGGRAKFLTLNDREAVLALRHPNGDEHTETFTYKDAEAAGLTKPSRNGEPSMYTKYPKAMLRSRAITAGLKAIGWSGAVGNYAPDEAREFAPESAAGAIASVQASETHATEREAVDDAPPAASEYQLAKILELCDHVAVEEKLADKIRSALKKGITSARADEILVGLETTIKKATPAPAPSESERIHALTQDLNALLTSDKIAPGTQNTVRERLSKSDLTPDVLEQAIAELRDAEIPF